MKKIAALASLLFAIAGCTTPTENTNRAATNANSGMETRPAAKPPTAEEAFAKEKAAWDSIKNKDYDAFATLLATDQIYVGSSGVMDKTATLNDLKNFEPTEVTFSDWKYLPIDKDAVVVTYTANVKAKMNGKEVPPETARCSSAWVNRDGKWVAIYHQESMVRPPMTPPGRNKAKPATSPTSTPPAVVTGPNAETNERAIWDALKSKNIDGFASALAPDSIEVEPDGVYDKAGSVKTVGQFDFSKATLSEFRTVKLDDDASLVTYKVSGFAPTGERHTTIWANRNGKWLAVFHHGTIIEAAKPGMQAKPGASPSPKAAASPSPRGAASPATKRPGTR